MENDKTCPEHVTVDLTGVGGWEDFLGAYPDCICFFGRIREKLGRLLGRTVEGVSGR